MKEQQLKFYVKQAISLRRNLNRMTAASLQYFIFTISMKKQVKRESKIGQAGQEKSLNAGKERHAICNKNSQKYGIES